LRLAQASEARPEKFFMDLEQELQHALSRKDPPAGFADRVEAAARRPASSPPASRWLALAASIVLLVGGGAAYRRHQGEVAKQQLMQAMKLTAVKLNHIQTHVWEAGQ
jgi:hypothetical protein